MSRTIPSFAIVAVSTALVLLPGGCSRGAGGSASSDGADEVARIADRGGSGAGKALVAALGHSDPNIRAAALAGLGEHVTAGNRPAIEKATRDAHAAVRAGAAATLGLYQDDRAADRLGEMLKADREGEVRLAAVSGLGENPSQKSIVALLDCAEGDADGQVKVQAMKALLDKLGLRFYRQVDPEGSREWRALLEELKHNKVVRAAYEATGAKLVYRPEDKTPDAPGHQE